ncbi:hypothetical protein [Variovorax sp. PAMC26660]|uniref:hypothetical protein n=1 Tax=Variovorax sp. PAMC26660 TaxID=2762322 RepID=UPI00164CEE38|nr:hypothetical protein [Variovorax sp. PAMC26660]QNK65803.1 hypothetical protein H7F35_21635 [Variovorax sp. PAMC26660]
MNAGSGFLAKRALATQGIYRFPPFGDLQVKAVERALRMAWDELVKNPLVYKIDLAAANEVAISEGLVRVVDMIRDAGAIPAFTKHFETPHTDGSLRNFNGTKLSKRPDMSFKLKVNPVPGIHGMHHRLFVEAKILETGKQGMSDYCKDGLSRYIVGDYAWAMPHAMMLAYVRSPAYVLPKSLNMHLSKPTNKLSYEVLTLQAAMCEYTSSSPRAYETTHGRAGWTFSDGTAPTSIKLIHLWLPV